MRHSTKSPTPAEQERLDAIHAMPCIACEKELEFAKRLNLPRLPQDSRTEAHHLVDKGNRVHSGGHMATIPLCGWHHRGDLTYPLSSREMRDCHGPSFARSKKDFIAQYGTERKLLEEVNQRLEKQIAA